MLKVLIVDDDSVSRTNLKTLIDWEKNGFEICGEAVNGLNAIQMIKDEMPDIVITDISMPIMDGTALIEYVEQNFPCIKTIALSGYDDFNYVRKSMKSGALDYVLKHTLTPDSLIGVLNASRDRILKDRRENDQRNRIQEQLAASRSILRKNFINQLVMGEVSDLAEIENKINSLDLEIESRNLAVVVAEIDDFHFMQSKYTPREIKVLISSIIDISSKILDDMGKAVISHIEGGKFVIIFSFGNMRSDLYIYNHIFTSVDRIKTSIKRYLNITASFSLSKLFTSIIDISKHFKEADDALRNKFYKGKDNIIHEPSIACSEFKFMNLELSDEKNIIASIKSMSKDSIEESIRKIFARVYDQRLDHKSVQMVCAELINLLNRSAREASVDIRIIYSDEDIPYEKMKKFETLKEVEEWILYSYEKLIDEIRRRKIPSGYSENIKKTIDFIHKNYTRNISLNDAAEHIGVNRSYLSRLFKEECGKGFVEYLNFVRVEHSKRLIENGHMKIKDIVKEVGFNNYTYFFKVFKDIIGMTPLEYEEKCKK